MNLLKRAAGLVPALAMIALCAVPQYGYAQPAPVPRNDVGQTGTITYQTGTVSLGLNADSTCSIEVAGTFVGTLQFQGAIAAGSPFAVAVRSIGGGTTTVTTTTTTGRWVTGCGGFSQLSVTATAWTSGTATVTLLGSAGSNLSHVVIPVAPSPQASIIVNQGTSPFVVTTPPPTTTVAVTGIANPLPVSPPNAESEQTGSITSSAVDYSLTNVGWSTIGLSTTGTFTGTFQIQCGASSGGTTTLNSIAGTNISGPAFSANITNWFISIAGCKTFIIHPTTAVTGTVNIFIHTSLAGIPSPVFISAGSSGVSVSQGTAATRLLANAWPVSLIDGNGNTPVACNKQAVVNISSATTTAIVAVSGSTAIYICSYHLYVVSGTLPSFQFEYGTGAACTSPTVMSGTFGGVAAAVGESFEIGAGFGSILQTPASQGFCILSGGTTPNIQGFINYAQF